MRASHCEMLFPPQSAPATSAVKLRCYASQFREIAKDQDWKTTQALPIYNFIYSGVDETQESEITH
jgi:hypothetical protein